MAAPLRLGRAVRATRWRRRRLRSWEVLDGGAGLGPPRGPHRGREPRQHARVQPVGLGQDAVGAGDVARLARIDDDDWQASGAQGGDHGPLVANRWLPARCGSAAAPRAAPATAAGRRVRARPSRSSPWAARPRPTGPSPHRSPPSRPLVPPLGTLRQRWPRALPCRCGFVLAAPAPVRALGQRAGRDDPAL